MDFSVDVGRADELVRAARWDEAFSIVDEALEVWPDDAGLWYRMARIELDRGNYRDAIQAAETAIDIEPDNFGARSILATILLNYGKYEKAIAVTDQIVELWPAMPYSYYERAEAYHGSYVSLSTNLEGFEPREYLAAGLVDIDRAIELDPTIVYFHMLRGHLLNKWGALDDARAAWQHVLRLDPTNRTALAELDSEEMARKTRSLSRFFGGRT